MTTPVLEGDTMSGHKTRYHLVNRSPIGITKDKKFHIGIPDRIPIMKDGDSPIGRSLDGYPGHGKTEHVSGDIPEGNPTLDILLSGKHCHVSTMETIRVNYKRETLVGRAPEGNTALPIGIANTETINVDGDKPAGKSNNGVLDEGITAPVVIGYIEMGKRKDGPLLKEHETKSKVEIKVRSDV